MNRENVPNYKEYRNEGLQKWTENAILTTTTKPPRHTYAMCGMVNASGRNSIAYSAEEVLNRKEAEQRVQLLGIDYAHWGS
jgi:hypothetical protein